MAKHPPRLLELAKRGAETQLRDLLREAKMLLDLFPHLRDSFDREELPLKFVMAERLRRDGEAAQADVVGCEEEDFSGAEEAAGGAAEAGDQVGTPA